MKVEVKITHRENFIGFADHARRRPGDVFPIADKPRRPLKRDEKAAVDAGNEEYVSVYNMIKDADGLIPRDFSFKWMTPVDVSTPERVSTSPEAMLAASEKIKEEKAAARPGRMAAM